jgi:hypothetical protein
VSILLLLKALLLTERVEEAFLPLLSEIKQQS